MKMKKYIFPAITVLVLAFLMSGCSWPKRYGKLRLQSESMENVTTQVLYDTRDDYNIYYAGYYGNVSIKHPSAVMFDPKGDVKALVGDRWTKVTNDIWLAKLIRSIETQESVGGPPPKIWRMLGPDDEFYGYMLSGWDHVVMKTVDDRKMLVYDLPMPGYLDSPLNGPASGPSIP
jgi:hypothetical protein